MGSVSQEDLVEFKPSHLCSERQSWFLQPAGSQGIMAKETGSSRGSTGEKLDPKDTRRVWGSSWVVLGYRNLVGGLCLLAEDSVGIPKINIQQC